LILKRCNFFWICLRHGPNADRFHNNGKIPIKLADSRGKSFDSAMPGGVDELVLAPAKIENCAGCMAKHRTWVSELPGGIASAGRGGRSNGHGSWFARLCRRDGIDVDCQSHRFFRARRNPLSLSAAAQHGTGGGPSS